MLLGLRTRKVFSEEYEPGLLMNEIFYGIQNKRENLLVFQMLIKKKIIEVALPRLN